MNQALAAEPSFWSLLRRPRTPLPTELALPLEIQAGPWPSIFRTIAIVVSGTLAILLTLAAISPLRELSIATGEIVPEGQILPIEHLEGGIVQKIFVKPGEVVEQGGTLIVMEPVSAQSDQQQLTNRRTNLMGASIRLNALLQDISPDYSSLKSSGLVYAEQDALFRLEHGALQQTRSLYQSRQAQKIAEIAAAQTQIKGLQAQIDARAERLQMNEDLIKDKLTSKGILLDSKIQLEQSRLQLAQLLGKIEVDRASLEEIKSELADTEAARHVVWSQELAKAAAELAETAPMLAKMHDRVDRLYIKAPVRALVHSVTPKAIGDVLKPGEKAVELVPLDGKLVAEVKIRPEDIGYVQPGKPARLKLSAFDSEVFGVIEATVVSVSPTTFETEKGEPYFKSVLSLSKRQLSRGTEVHEVLPGMVVRAEIITGEKSILRYLLKPIFRSFDRAFSER